MSDRSGAITAFINASGWGDAAVGPLAGDASNRRYLRLNRGDETAVLMDAPAEKGEDIRPFVRIAQYLNHAGFSAPKIYAADNDQGLMLLEDLGDALFARILSERPELETLLYTHATDLLVDLHRQSPPPDLAAYDVTLMANMAALAFDWYLTAVSGEDSGDRAGCHTAIKDALTKNAPEQTVLIQRDYHSENLLWIPQRSGIARVGLLDFQDAMLGHPAYDLVSLLQDARRDVTPLVETQMIQHYVNATGISAERFSAAYHTLGAQRNLRILGIFARLCIRDGKAHYVDLIPRVWDLLMRDLSHDALSDLSALVRKNLPAPTPEILSKLKAKCAPNHVQ